MEKTNGRLLSRRRALKVLAGLTGGVALTNIPGRWSTPQIDVGVLPAFAQCSESDDAALLMITNDTNGTASVTLDEAEGPGHYGLSVAPQDHGCIPGIEPGAYDVCLTITGGSCPRQETCLKPFDFSAGDAYGLEIDCSGQELFPYDRFRPKPNW